MTDRVPPVRCNHCHGRGTVKPEGGASRVCAWCKGLGYDKPHAIPKRVEWDGYPESGPNELGHTKGCKCDGCYSLTHATRNREAELDDYQFGYEMGYADGTVGEYRKPRRRDAGHPTRKRVERCEDCAAVLGQHEPCSYTDCPHALPNRVRDEAVRIVDTRHGYTAEHAPDPESHRAEYDAEEAAHATRNREAEIRADERHRIAAEIDRLEPRYPNLVSRAAIRKLLNA